MSSQKTQNYDLNQWLPADSVLRTDFNADNAKIDAALSAMSEQVVQKANQSALDTLITAVNQKADQADLTALSQTHASDVSQLRAESCVVLLKKAVLGSTLSSYTLTIPDWGDYSELHLRYNLTGTGEIAMKFNDGFSCYLTSSGSTLSAITLKYSSGAFGTGTAILRRCGSTGQLSCSMNGVSLGSTGSGGSGLNSHYGVVGLTASALTSLTFQSDGGTITSGSTLALYGVK